MRWGLIPCWAKDSSFRATTINAVSETAAEKAAFREPLRRRRCLIPANGFYEWKTVLGQKQPYHIGLADEGLFAFAGLWDRWEDSAGKVIESRTILTTEANTLLKDIHNRMPVILKLDDYDRWLDPGVTNPKRVVDLLRPYDPRRSNTEPVDTDISGLCTDGCSPDTLSRL